MKLLEQFRPPEHLIGIADDARPVSVAKEVNDLRRARPVGRQISSEDYEVGRDQFQVCGDRFEGRQVAVNVGDECDPDGQLPVGGGSALSFWRHAIAEHAQVFRSGIAQ